MGFIYNLTLMPIVCLRGVPRLFVEKLSPVAAVKSGSLRVTRVRMPPI